MRKIFFIGIHNKPGMQPLDSATKTGKIVDSIIASSGIPRDAFIKTNLFYDHVPPTEQKGSYVVGWYKKYNPSANDIIVMLGNEVAQAMPISAVVRSIKLQHPGYVMKKGHIQILYYTTDAVAAITAKYFLTPVTEPYDNHD